ncbi:unnamed protein product, partial [Symbiodinium sp. KB8]
RFPNKAAAKRVLLKESSEGETAKDIAVKHGWDDIVSILEKALKDIPPHKYAPASEGFDDEPPDALLPQAENEPAAPNPAEGAKVEGGSGTPPPGGEDIRRLDVRCQSGSTRTIIRVAIPGSSTAAQLLRMCWERSKMPGLSVIRDYEGKELSLAQPLREQIGQDVRRLLAEDAFRAGVAAAEDEQLQWWTG